MNKAVFFAACGPFTRKQVAALDWLLDRLDENGPPLASHAAYMLATVKHETADTYEPVREAFNLSDAWRKRNLRYYPWYGRGYVQLTWEKNYKEAGKKLGQDFTTNPDVVMQPENAYAIMLRGMIEGWFTGKKLHDYIGETHTDYINARRIINGTDKASLVAGYAKTFEHALRAADYAPRETTT